MLPYRILLVTISVLLLGTAAHAGAKDPDRKPNILLVVADDLGWTDLGSFGGEIDTPNLDELAGRGVQFTNFHTSVSCSPTRSMLLSGTDNHLAGLGNMGELLTPEQVGKPGYEGHLNNRVVALPEVLRDAGYHTYMAGKWHLGHEPEDFPHARGFDRSFSMLFGGASYWSDMYGLSDLQRKADYVLDDEKLEELPKDFYATRSYTDFLIEAIRENHGDDKPFFAYLAFTAPHDPLHVPEPWLSKYHGNYDDGYDVLKAKRSDSAQKLGLVPSGVQAPTPQKALKPWADLTEKERAISLKGMEVYAGVVENMDFNYGRVVEFLKDIGEYDNTIIIFMSDNGSNPWFSEDYPGNRGSEWFEQFDNSAANIGEPMSHYAYGLGWGSAGAGPLDLFKMTVGEGGVRSPMLIAGPGIKGKRRADAFAYVWDVMPTILEYAGASHPAEFKGKKVEPMRGKPLNGMLAGSATEVYGPDDFVGGEMLNGKWMRQGDFKAVSVAAPYGPGAWHLYNLAEDPGETHDLSKEQPERLKKLQAAWDSYAKDVGVVLSK